MDGWMVVAMNVTTDRGLDCGHVGGVRVGVGGMGWGGRCSIFTPCVDARGCEKKYNAIPGRHEDGVAKHVKHNSWTIVNSRRRKCRDAFLENVRSPPREIPATRNLRREI